MTTSTTTTTAKTYQSVMRHQFIDRKGYEPILSGFNRPDLDGLDRFADGDTLKVEHDWVLLIFARSDSLRRMAARGAEILRGKLPENCAYLADAADIRTHRHCATLAALSGREFQDSAIGFISWRDAVEALADAFSEA